MDDENQPKGDWRPIATAPLDGSWVMLAGGCCEFDEGNNDERPVVAQWTNYLNGENHVDHGRWQFAWYDGGFCGHYKNPTHWTPLPSLPGHTEK